MEKEFNLSEKDNNIMTRDQENPKLFVQTDFYWGEDVKEFIKRLKDETADLHFGKYTEFDAEVEFSLGEECEMHLINRPTAVHVPIGMIHGPMNFKRIDQPIIFIDTLLSAQYAVR